MLAQSPDEPREARLCDTPKRQYRRPPLGRLAASEYLAGLARVEG